MSRVYPRLLWDKMWSSYWFVPAAMTLGAAALAIGSLYLDSHFTPRKWWFIQWLEVSGVEGARTTLGVIAGSMITIAGVTFSIIIVALSLASQQFGPRLLYAFMGDRGNQVVLGSFIATFLFCLIVVRQVRSNEDADIVPHLSVTFALLLSMVSLGVLIYFLHHAATTIQAEYVVAAVSDDLRRTIRQWTPPADDEQPPLTDEETAPPEHAAPLLINDSGYIQGIDDQAICALAAEHDLRIHLSRRVGQFVVPDQVIGWVAPAARCPPEVAHEMLSSIVTGRRRTHTQDVEFGVDQLVEVGVRALSPGINDPFTAMMCIDQMSSALSVLLRRGAPHARYFDEDGRLRLTMHTADHAGIIDAAYDLLRQTAAGHVGVLMRLLESISALGAFARTGEQRDALRRQAMLIHDAARRSIEDADDLAAVADRFRAAMQALDVPAAAK